MGAYVVLQFGSLRMIACCMSTCFAREAEKSDGQCLNMFEQLNLVLKTVLISTA